MSTTLKYILDTRISGKNGFSLKLRIIHNRTSSHLSTGFYIHSKDWDIKNERLKASSKQFANSTRFNNNLQEAKAKYFEVISDLEREGKLQAIKASQLKSYFIDKPREILSLMDFIKICHENKKRAGKSGTARTYKDLYNKLLKFSGNHDLSFVDIDYKFLTELEREHLANGSKYSSLSVYLRTLRSLFNEATKLGHVSQKHYPFNTYKIKNGEPNRRALSAISFKKLSEASFEKGSALQIGRDYYLASFYLHGINWMDLCHLQYSNFSDDLDRISYVRRKTGKSFSIKVSKKLIEVVNRLKPLNINLKTDFVFPVLHIDDDPLLHDTIIGNRRGKINKYLKMVSKELNLESFSIYSARHTFATLLWEKTGSASTTQMSLGHKTEEQTQEYLSYFGNTKVDEASESLFKEL